jgi:hypothetical protein
MLKLVGRSATLHGGANKEFVTILLTFFAKHINTYGKEKT